MTASGIFTITKYRHQSFAKLEKTVFLPGITKRPCGDEVTSKPQSRNCTNTSFQLSIVYHVECFKTEEFILQQNKLLYMLKDLNIESMYYHCPRKLKSKQAECCSNCCQFLLQQINA